VPHTVRSTKRGSGVHLDGGSLDMKGVGWMVYTDIACEYSGEGCRMRLLLFRPAVFHPEPLDTGFSHSRRALQSAHQTDQDGLS